MSKINQKKLIDISRNINLEEIGIELKPTCSADIIIKLQQLVPFKYFFERKPNSIYYHIIPNYRRKLNEKEPINSTDNERELNHRINNLIYPHLHELTLLYLLHKNESITIQKLLDLNNRYASIIDMFIPTTINYSMLQTAYPYLPADILNNCLRVIAGATCTSSSLINITPTSDNLSLRNYIIDTRNFIMGMYPSLQSINQNSIRIKSAMSAHKLQLQTKVSESNTAINKQMYKCILSQFDSYLPNVPKYAILSFDIDNVINILAKDNNYTKQELKYLASKKISAEHIGIFGIEYLIIYSYYAEIMPHTNIYMSFRFQKNDYLSVLSSMQKELNAILKITESKFISTESPIPKNAHAISALVSETNPLMSQLLLNPMHNANIPVSKLFTSHTFSMRMAYQNTDMDDIANNIQLVLHTLSVQSQLLADKINTEEKLPIETTPDINVNNTNNELYHNLENEITRYKQELEMERNRYAVLSKELAPYENLKLKVQDLQDQLDIQTEINSEIDEQLERLINNTSEESCVYDEEKFINQLQTSNVFIVGGHDHWRSDMQALLPDAKIIVPEHNNASVDNARNADYIIVNTSMLNHPMYRRVKAAYQFNTQGKMLYINTQASNISRTLQLLYTQIL